MLYLRPLLKYFFILLAGFLLSETGLHASVPYETDHTGNEEAVFSDNFSRTRENPLHLPFGGETNEFETQDETDNQEDPEEEWKTLVAPSLPHHCYCRLSDKSCTLQRVSRLKNRNRVLLFILYHSWKSFPA